MNRLTQAAAISIIGGADGPTSIYISKNGTFFSLLIIVFIILMATGAIYFFVKNVKSKNKKGIIISSSFCGIFLLGFVCLAIISLSSVITHAKIYSTLTKDFSKVTSQLNNYTVKEIDEKLEFVNSEFPFTKLNSGLVFSSDQNIKLYNNLDYVITGCVIYADGHELSIKYDFLPKQAYEISFNSLEKDFIMKEIGIFWKVPVENGELENHEMWTSESAKGMNCLFE